MKKIILFFMLIVAVFLNAQDYGEDGSELIQAINQNNIKKVIALIANGADVNKKSLYYSTLSFARQFGTEEFVKIIIDAGGKE